MRKAKTYDVATLGYGPDELFVKRLDALTTPRAVLTKETYFEGGDVLACHAGCFRFSFKGEDRIIDLHPEEILVIYPGNTVTIEAIERSNNLKYAIFGGARVADFFDSFGFYDLLRFKGNTQEALFDVAMKVSATNVSQSFAYIADALGTFSKTLSTRKDARLHRTLHVIHRAVQGGTPRIKTICDELGVSRATLNRLFDEAELGTPSDYLHSVQFRRARQLLQTTALPISEIADKMGFSSSVYFTEFIRKYAKMTPSELRRSASV